MTSADPFGQHAVRRAYDTVAEDYAAQLPDTRAEAPLDLAMLDAFAAAVTADGDPSVLDAGSVTRWSSNATSTRRTTSQHGW